jgi:hypothetical protein
MGPIIETFQKIDTLIKLRQFEVHEYFFKNGESSRYP